MRPSVWNPPVELSTGEQKGRRTPPLMPRAGMGQDSCPHEARSQKSVLTLSRSFVDTPKSACHRLQQGGCVRAQIHKPGHQTAPHIFARKAPSRHHLFAQPYKASRTPALVGTHPLSRPTEFDASLSSIFVRSRNRETESQHSSLMGKFPGVITILPQPKPK